MTVVRREKRRRWLVVLAAVLVLSSLPVAVEAWPARTPGIDAATLRDRIRASAAQPYQGYAESAGVLGLPPLPRLGQVVALLSGQTRMRAWYGDRNRWRVDVVDTGNERGVYRTSTGTYLWDYGANQLTYVQPVPVGVVIDEPDADGTATFTELLGESPARLPRGADLVPPDLARRLLDIAEADPVRSLPGRRIAGITAAGLRITPSDPRSMVGHIDIWADPRTGLPLQVEITARAAERAILVSRFLDVTMERPGDAVLTPPVPTGDISYGRARSADTSSVFEVRWPFGYPDRLGGLPIRDDRAGSSRPGGRQLTRFDPGQVYGTGLAEVLVLPLSNRIAGDVYRSAAAWGQPVQVPDARAAVIAAPLLSVMVVQSSDSDRTFLIVGTIDAELMRQVGVDLAEAN